MTVLKSFFGKRLHKAGNWNKFFIILLKLIKADDILENPVFRGIWCLLFWVLKYVTESNTLDVISICSVALILMHKKKTVVQLYSILYVNNYNPACQRCVLNSLRQSPRETIIHIYWKCPMINSYQGLTPSLDV